MKTKEEVRNHLNEIPQEAEFITLKAAQEYFETLAKKLSLYVEHYSIGELNFAVDDEFVHIGLRMKNPYVEDDKLFCSLEAQCSIRKMGKLDPDEMFEASDQIGAAAKVTEVFNKRMKHVTVIF